MGDLFNKRMSAYKKEGSAGRTFVENTSVINDKLFEYDQAYKKGKIYDWEMNEIAEIDFKFGKQKTYEPEGYDIEYWVQFRPYVYPELLYKDLYYKKDGRKRFGFYLDVPDYEQGTVDKWIIINKDDKVSFDRYIVYKCNWCFEWVYKNHYYNCLGVVRDKNDNATNDVKKNRTLGGTSVYDDISIYVPQCEKTSTLILGTRLIISDNDLEPHVYEIVNGKDTVALGVDKIYFTRCLFNNHTDFIGTSDDFERYNFNIDNDIDDLPDGYGGKYHKICNIIDSKILPPINDEQDSLDYSLIRLTDVNKYLYVNGSSVIIRALNMNNILPKWHIYIDGKEYNTSQLQDYFDINIDNDKFSIKAINKVMAKYVVRIAISDDDRNYFKFVEMEVKV